MDFKTELGEEVFLKKYAGEFKGRPNNYYRNLAKLVSLGDPELAEKFAEGMLAGRFSPGGRILAYGGREAANTSLMNCTTHRVEDDSLDAISETVRTIMLASSHGQGIGVDLSQLRPKGARVNNAAKTSTGAISFMELFNHVGGTIGQEGRRAALLFSMRIDHPDLWREDGYDFLHVKRIPGKVENANISVMITDAFMEAVEKNEPWLLSFTGVSGGETFHVERQVMALDLFNEIVHSAWSAAEPGVLFIDTIKKASNSDIMGDRWGVAGVNACSEMCLDQDGVCNLGSLNLASYVQNPYTSSAWFDFYQFNKDTALYVEFLDNILEIELTDERSISEKQRQSIINLRRVGLGVMGLADALVMLGLRYNRSSETLDFIKKLFGSMRDTAYHTSAILAKRKGACQAWASKSVAEREVILRKGFYATLPQPIYQAVLENGLRNVTLLSIAPTGSISNVLGVSSGIEPLFAREYVRRVTMGGDEKLVTYVHPGVAETRALGLPDEVWDTSYDVSPMDHVIIQALVQEYVDSAIAKTTNLPADATVDDVAAIFMLAWKMGLKGITVYRDSSRDLQVLYSNDKKA